MRWVAVILLVVGLVLIAVGVAGKVDGGRLPGTEIVTGLLDAQADQSDQDKADDLMDRVAALDAENAAFEAEARRLIGKVVERDPSPEEASAALPRFADAMAALDRAAKNRETVATLWDRVASLDVSGELNVYAGMMKELAGLFAGRDAAMWAVVAQFERVYRNVSTPTKADLEKQYLKLDDLERRVRESEALAAKQWETCRQYYQDHFE